MARVRFTVLLIFALACSAAIFAEGEYESGNGKPLVILEYFEDSSDDFRIVFEDGEVLYAESLFLGQEIPIDATLVTGKGDFAELRLYPNGSIIKVSENTYFGIEALQGHLGEGESIFSVPIGKIRAIVSRAVGDEMYRFKGETTVCSVRGTDFGMEIFPGEKEILFVLDGSVEYANAAGQSIEVTSEMMADGLDPDFHAISIPEGKFDALMEGLEFKKLKPTSVPGTMQSRLEEEGPEDEVTEKVFSNAVSLDLLGGLPWLRVDGSYERHFIVGFSGKLGLEFWRHSLDGWAFMQVGIFPEVRYYLGDLFNLKALNGAFVGAGAGMYYISGSSEVRVYETPCSFSVDGFFIGPSVEVGYKFILNFPQIPLSGFFIEPSLGYSYCFGQFNASSTCTEADQIYIYNRYRPGGFMYKIRFGFAF